MRGPEIVGTHAFYNGDLEKDGEDFALLTDDTQDILVYVDPPWGQALVTNFRNKANAGPGSDFTGFMFNLCAVIKSIDPSVAYMEMGRKDQATVLAVLDYLEAVVLKEWDIVYYGNRPCKLTAFNWRGTPSEGLPDLTGQDDKDTPLLSIQHHQPELVVDPCSGQGLTSRSAEKCGVPSLNLELGEKRHRKAVQHMEKTIGR